MTSANVTNYRIMRNGEVVGEHHQNHYCHTKWHRLYKFTPFSEHTIQKWWLDEEEEYHEGIIENLSDFLQDHQPRIYDMNRMIEYIEKQNALLKEWVDKFGDQDKQMRLVALNSISYSPL